MLLMQRRPPWGPMLSLQHGLSLPVVLMFLVVVTVIGTLGVKRATVSEALTRNQLDLEVARQAAEAALRDGERDLMLTNGALRPGALCARNDDRPLIDAMREPHFSNACPRGQCRFEGSYYETSDIDSSPPVNPHPWWPLDKSGLWVPGAKDPETTSTKPSDAAAVGTNCNFTGGVPLGTFTGAARFASVAQQPEYLIEYLRRGDEVFMRVTARGFGSDDRTEVVVQSYFKPPLN